MSSKTVDSHMGTTVKVGLPNVPDEDIMEKLTRWFNGTNLHANGVQSSQGKPASRVLSAINQNVGGGWVKANPIGPQKRRLDVADGNENVKRK